MYKNILLGGCAFLMAGMLSAHADIITITGTGYELYNPGVAFSETIVFDTSYGVDSATNGGYFLTAGEGYGGDPNSFVILHLKI
jgi:hypothetical protein